jgi:hypothetical protein
MNKFTQSTSQVQAPQPPPAYSDRQFLHTSSVGVSLPLAQATVTAGMVMLGTLAVLYLFDAIDLFKLPIFLGIFTWIATWLYLQRRWLKLTELEKWFGDLNHDGYIGEPPKKVTITVNRVKEDQHIEQMQHTFSVSDQQIQRFFTTVKTSTRGGRGISRRQWTPKNIHGFSEGEWDTFYSELIKQSLVTMRGTDCVLTKEGEEIADGWYSRARPPSPTE